MNNIFYDVDDMSSWRVPNPKQLSKEQAKQLQRELGVKDDGIVGKGTITALQRRLGVDADGKWGNQSTTAWIDEYNDEAQERFNYNRAKEQGKVNPAVVDLFAPVSSKSIKEEEPYTNIEVDNVELAQLDDEIAKVKAMIADRQSKYESVPMPNTQVGWASYIANNDRGMLDKYQDAERAWYNKMKDQEYAQKLAAAQRQQQDILNMDEIMKNRSIAAANYQYAVAAREADTSKDPAVEAMLKQKEAEAKATLDYWNKRTGFDTDGTTTQKEDKATPEGNAQPAISDDGTTTNVDISDYKAIKSFKTQADKDATLAKMEAHPAIKDNEKFRDEYNRIKLIVPVDVKAAKVAQQFEADKKAFASMNNIEKDNFLESHPNYTAVKGVLQLKKK